MKPEKQKSKAGEKLWDKMKEILGYGKCTFFLFSNVSENVTEILSNIDYMIERLVKMKSYLKEKKQVKTLKK